jgi:galactose mutarotase-like enzyme
MWRKYVVERVKFKGIEAVQLENDQLRCIFLPSYGSKLVSLYDKTAEYEWLFQAKGEILKKPDYGAKFSDYDSSGFDEVFPSIDPCYHPTFNKNVPDHGELWALEWRWKWRDGQLTFYVEGKEFPYQVKKKVRLKENGLIIEYCIKNMSSQTFPFIWTPHALLNMNEYTSIDIPSNLTEIMTVEHKSGHLGKWGTRHPFPITISRSTGEQIDLSKMVTNETIACEKYYFTEELDEGLCATRQEDIGKKLIYRYPSEKIPYLGVWITNGGYRGDYNFALEPCTGIYDDLYVAMKIKKVSEIPPNGNYEWLFSIEIEEI